MEIPTVGSKLIAVGTRGLRNLTKGKEYEVIAFMAVSRPSVVVKDDDGKPAYFNLSRFTLVGDQQSS